MSQIIYLIVESGGEYDDSWENAVCAHITKEAAEADVVQLIIKRERMRELNRMAAAAFFEKQAACPIKSEDIPYPPKGPAKPNKQTAAEHKVLLDEWRLIHAEICGRNNKKMNERTEICQEYAIEVVRKFGANEEEINNIAGRGQYYCSSGEISNFNISEIELKG